MPQFSYRARNAQGGLVEGVLDCPDRAVAIRQIEQLHYIPVRIEAVSTEPSPVTKKSGKNGAAVATAPVIAAAPATPTQKLKIPHNQLLIFTEQLGRVAFWRGIVWLPKRTASRSLIPLPAKAAGAVRRFTRKDRNIP